MAEVKVEHGYTRIANEILEQVALRKFNGTQWAILAIIWRCTYGWSKASYSLSESYIAKATGVDKRNIRRELQKLINIKVITVVKEATFSSSREIAFNKNYEQWLTDNPQRVKCTPEGENTHSSEGENTHSPGGEFTPQKRNIKRNNKKNIGKPQKTNKFVPPTVKDVQAYCIKRNNGVDAKKFFDYYNVADWKDQNGKQVRNWKQKVITWEKNQGNNKTIQQSSGNSYRDSELVM